ncbi:MAG: hypothetical protein ACE5JG_13520, partial [Planctomycetota bacterium]
MAALLLVVPALLAQEEAAPQRPSAPAQPEHDELGYPIAFDDEVITRADALRSLGIRPQAVGNPKQARDDVLRRKLLERAAALAGIKVTKLEIDDTIRRQADRLGGDAEY